MAPSKAGMVRLDVRSSRSLLTSEEVTYMRLGYVCMLSNMHIYLYTYRYTYTHTGMKIHTLCMYTHTCRYAHAFVHGHTYTYMHTL